MTARRIRGAAQWAKSGQGKLVKFWSDGLAGARAFGHGVRFVVRMLVGAAPRLAAAMLFLTLVQATLPVVNVRLTQLIVNTVAGGRAVTALVTPLAIYLTLHLTAAGLDPTLRALQAVVNERLMGQVQLLVLAKVNTFTDLTRFEDPALYDDLQLIGNRAAYLPRQLLQNTSRLAEIALSSAGLCLLLASLHPLIPLVLVAVTVPAIRAHHQNAKLTWGDLGETIPWERRQDYWLEVGTSARHAREVQLLGIPGWVRDQFAQCLLELDRRRWRLRRRLLEQTLGALGVRFVGTAAVFLYLVARGASGRLLPGDFVLFLGSFLLLDGHLRFVPFFVARMIEHGQITGRFLAFLQPDQARRGDLASLPVGTLRNGIEVENVSFGYPGREERVLREVSFRIRPGETIALVGKNGAGKTTLVKLLTGLYQPTGGRIRIDGRDLSEYDLASLRARVAVVFQDYGRYCLTAGENIGLGCVEAMEDRERTERAARDGGSDTLMQRLELGYETRLGKEFGGTELSGGEWQRLALSRAFMRDADLLILDEPTAALDVRAEAEIYQRFRALLGGRAGLLISHRFSTVRMADRILVLEDGHIVEEGPHESLLARGGLYAEMFRLQAAAIQTCEEVVP